MPMTSFSTPLILLVSLFIGLLPQFALAMPTLVTKDVYVPPITYPTANAVWSVGEVQTVTWDASTPPKQITNPNGRIFLRAGDLTTPLVLANNFNILDGKVNITVPNVITRSDYSIVLFGDSGNFSPQFQIKGVDL